MKKPKLYIHVGQARHFLKWEYAEFKKYFDLVDEPDDKAILLAFGPDVLESASLLPALKRCTVLFPGFGHNPLHNHSLNKKHRSLIKKYYDLVFINPGPLQLAYRGLENIELYPFSVNEALFEKKKTRKRVKKIVHISNDSPQKDWQRSERIMKNLGIKCEVFPPRDQRYFERTIHMNNKKNAARKLLGLREKQYLPYGYVGHDKIIKKYYDNDAFIHVAAEIKDELYLDGKYTATLIEAGMSGCIIFWHDTYDLGNNLKTVFNVPLDEDEAAQEIKSILSKLDIPTHSEATRNEMLKTFNVGNSVRIRANAIYKLLGRKTK